MNLASNSPVPSEKGEEAIGGRSTGSVSFGGLFFLDGCCEWIEELDSEEIGETDVQFIMYI